MNANHRIARALLAILVLGVAGPSLAMEGVGLFAGLDHSQLSGDVPKDFEFQKGTGYTFGAVVEFSLSPDVRLSIQPGYLRSTTQINFKDQLAGAVRDSLNLDIDWIVLPILARVKSETGGLYATGGLDFAWAVDGGLSGGETEEPAESFIRDVDLSAVFGVGIEFEVGRNSILLELRYRQGFLNAAREDTDFDNDSVPARFRFAGLQLLGGVLFGGGGP